MTRLWTVFFSAMLCAFSVAQAAAPQRGWYVSDGGLGILKVMRGAKGPARFQLNYEGWHACFAEGVIEEDGLVQMKEAPQADAPCLMRLEATAQGVRLEEKNCSAQFCGANASFPQHYRSSPAQCLEPGVDAARQHAAALYRAGKHLEAAALLAPLLAQCQPLLKDFAEARLRNDLGLIQLRAGKPQDCLQTLAPLQKLLTLSPQQLEEQLPWHSADAMQQALKAARTNLKLCQKSLR